MEPKINFIDKVEEPSPGSQRKKRFTRILVYFVLVILVVISVFSFSVIFTNNSLLKSFARFSFGSKSLGQDDRINILILGMGGAGHEGPFLTDTIILASIRPSTKQVALISVPRDLYVPIPGYGWNKVNYANALGEADGPGAGPELASQAVSETFSTPIDWWVRVDFTGFERLVDLLGGIDVYVERSFVDTQYPAPDFQYQTISFKKGWQKMSGARVLQFVRSRHGSADEGSDFARSRRQQKVIMAVREKLLDLKILTSPKKIWSIFNILKKYVITNLDIASIVELAGLVRKIPADKIISRIIDGGENGLLYPEVTIDGAYILKTKSGNFDELAEFARNVFDSGSLSKEGFSVAQAADSPVLVSSQTNLIVLNGTTVTGLAGRVSDNLKSAGFKICHIANAPKQNHENTIIYNLEEDTGNLDLLAEGLGIKSNFYLPDTDILAFIEKLKLAEKADLVVILGQDQIIH